MNPWDLPWLELALLTAVIGAVLSQSIRDLHNAFRMSIACTSLILFCTGAAWASLHWHGITTPAYSLTGQSWLVADGLSLSMATLTALLYFLTTVATGRTKMQRFSLAASFVSEAIQLAAFGCHEPWVLIGLLAVGTVPPYFVLRGRGQPTRVYVLHMVLFVVLLIAGWAIVVQYSPHERLSPLAAAPLLAAILIRCGAIPLHCWITDWFENASFGNAILFVAPLTGVYAMVRLGLPVAPDGVLECLGVVALLTALYAACMATIQREARRFFAYLFLSHSSLVLVGLALHTAISVTGALSMWISVTLALSGLGLTLRALEARLGRMSLLRFQGLYDHAPALAVCFLLTGLASVGFPGTIGFVAMEMLVAGAVDANPIVGVAVVVTATLNGIAIVRAYLLLFTGTRHISTISLNIGNRERFAVLTLATVILFGGLFPQPWIASRYEAAAAVLNDRAKRLSEESPHHKH